MPTPSLILVPARFKTGKLYTPLATTSGGVVLGASGDFNVTRATTATRVNASGLIEVVASGIPRLDYYTSGGTAGCPALLVEPSGTNGILNSQDTATNWALGANLSSGYVDVIGVSGNNLTVAVSGSNIGASAGRLTRSNNNVALASGSTYTISFLIKKTGTHTIGGYYALLTGAASGNLGGGFDVSGSFSSGQIYNTAGTTSRIRRVEQWGTDVYRCSETFTMTASGTLSILYFAPVATVTSTSNPAVGLGIAFAAPQVELGAIPTSFIPTTTAAVTRNADVINLSGAVSGCIGQTEGTIYAEVDMQRLILGSVFVLDVGGTGEYIAITKLATGAFRVSVKKTSTSAVNIITTTTNAVGVYKLALGYKSGDYALYINGVSRGTSTNSTDYPTGSLIQAVVSNTNYGAFNDWLRTPVTLYTTRLTNAELAALTTI
jgi:hypothetical protein